MSETDYQAYASPKSASDRTVMNVLYGLHTVAWLSAGSLAVIALVVNYIKRSGETDHLYISHHNYMISTFWWTICWLVVTSPLWLLLFFPGALAWSVIGLWYLYRCIRGWLQFSSQRFP